MSLQGGPSTPAPVNPGPAPPPQPATILAGDTPRRPKIKEPDVFRGERSKLREWLAQMKVYFRLVGWADGHDAEKIVYTTSLLRGSAGTWMTPYIEDLKQPSWTTWPQFAEELQNQFGIIDKKGEARNKLKNIIQGKRTMTEYWSEFRLVSSEAELDDATEGEWLLAGMNPTLQNAWGMDSNTYEDVDTLARWAMEKETKLAMIKNVQHGRGADHKATPTPRNQNGTYRPALTTQQGGDAMELDATRREPNLNLSAQEFRWRRNTKRCLKCAKIGHMIRECRNPKDARDHTALWKIGNSQTNTGRNTRSRIQEIEVEKETQEGEESGKDEDSQ